MNIALLLAGFMLPLAVTAAAPDDTRAPVPMVPRSGPAPESTPNLYPGRAGCTPIPRQVAGEDRRYNGTRLDQQPPGKALFAVHRSIDGCPVATLVSEERARRR